MAPPTEMKFHECFYPDPYKNKTINLITSMRGFFFVPGGILFEKIMRSYIFVDFRDTGEKKKTQTNV